MLTDYLGEEGVKGTESWGLLPILFLAVQDSSIGDFVSPSVRPWVSELTFDYNDFNDYSDYSDYNDYNDYDNYNDYNDYRDSDLDLDLEWRQFSELVTSVTSVTTVTTITKMTTGTAIQI